MLTYPLKIYIPAKPLFSSVDPHIDDNGSFFDLFLRDHLRFSDRYDQDIRTLADVF